jgi:hypothetical protein
MLFLNSRRDESCYWQQLFNVKLVIIVKLGGVACEGMLLTIEVR